MIKIKTENQNVWFTSDLHLNHSNICSATSVWEDKYSCREFSSINEMNLTILDNINSLVKQEDILFMLGDFLFRWKKPKDYAKMFQKIICNNIYFIIGNHDNMRSLIDFMDEYPDFNVIDVADTMFLQIDGRKVFLSHYSHQVWQDSHHGSYHLFGHSHGSLVGIGKSMDVGIDAAYNDLKEYRPYSWNEIKKRLDKIQVENRDYHNNKTT